MPVNRNTLLWYKTIDRMLRKGRKVTLDELIEACNDALYEANGYGEVSRRTIQHDIQEMRYSQALGYYAPIKVVDKKYYKYCEYGYSITQVPLSAEDMAQLSEAVDLLKQMSSERVPQRHKWATPSGSMSAHSSPPRVLRTARLLSGDRFAVIQRANLRSN